nr:ATP-dependent protease subunit HslV [Thermoanaerobaculia bacterium]
AKDWRTDRMLRQLEAMMIVADREKSYLVSGTGDLLQPDEDGLLAVGSGGPYALAAARALVRHTELPARAIAEAALGIAAGICIYTNDRLTIEEL